MSTLIYHTGALGDFITTIPAIRYYKKQNPGETITLLGRPAIGKFAKDIGLIDDWLDVDDKKLLPFFHDSFSGATQKLLSAFTAAVLFTGGDSPIVKNIARSGIKLMFQQPPFPASQMHVIDYHLSLFGDLESFTESDKIPTIVPSAATFAASEKIFHAGSAKPIAIHPGSGSGKKNWPFDRFLHLAGFIRSKQIPVLWIKGPAEDAIDFPSNDMTLSNLPFAVLAALLSKCRGYIGNDSGVTHLATAVGCPTVALFGPSDPGIWAPRGRDVTIISNRKNCASCHPSKSIHAPCDNSCLNDITVNEVLYIFS